MKTLRRRRGEPTLQFSERAAAAFGAVAFEHTVELWLSTRREVCTTHLCAVCAPGFGTDSVRSARRSGGRTTCTRCNAVIPKPEVEG